MMIAVKERVPLAAVESAPNYYSQHRLAVVCPMANEKDTAARFAREVLEQCSGWREVAFHAVFDNACKDGTVDSMRQLAANEPRLQVVWAPQNRCVVDAYIEGYKAALATGFEWILEIDAGFSHQPSDFAKFQDKVGPDVDCVFGSRFCPGGTLADAPLKRYMLSRGGTFVSNMLLGTKLSDMTSGYQLFQRDALQRVLDKGIKSRGHFFQTEMKFHCRDMRFVEVPIHYRAPSNSVSSETVAEALQNLFDLFKKRFSSSKKD
jgi:dolichol-phosphate mannosyltransferase